jgi:small subunit ribosomal protein S4
MPTQQPQGRGKPQRRVSRYGYQLAEKQRLKEVFGIRERQLRNYYEEAQRSEKSTGQQLVEFLERRLDNAVYRAGFAQTRAAARQLVSHGFFECKERSVNVPSMRLKEDMVITIKKSKRGKGPFVNFPKGLQNVETPSWILLNPDTYSFKVTGMPTADEANLGVDVPAVVEFFAR